MPQTRKIGVLCFAHLRWSFVYQRPQHIMTRVAVGRQVIYFEEPEFEAPRPSLKLRQDGDVTIVTPVLPTSITPGELIAAQRGLINDFLSTRPFLEPPLLWYYTPMALPFTRHLDGTRVYDCMDQLAAFNDAPAELEALERELLARCALVFTGGRSLYYAKRQVHFDVSCDPSAVDAAHFAPTGRTEPPELCALRRPRMVFCGVLDERLDVLFVQGLARELPDWELVFVGPTVKIDPAILPDAPNIHYLGMRSYEELPALIEHCDIALLPFALNDATRFISPTKTLEYLAARKPVISTPIADVVDPYGAEGIVCIAATPQQAAAYARATLREAPSEEWNGAVDRILATCSWDDTVASMERRIDSAALLDLEVAG